MAKNDDTKDKLTSSGKTNRIRNRSEVSVRLQGARLLDDDMMMKCIFHLWQKEPDT